MENAINWEIIKAGGAWYALPAVETDGKVEFLDISKIKDLPKNVVKIQGEENTRSWLLEHKNILEKIEKMIRDIIFI